ncbi:class III extradiol ring-cleavage dioxygenase [Paenibacillus sp. GD4]|uniref:DODA-type extradiol aromatic ring-opening family dioxygenase n=1 Tax=Paenibacillus sp. GD4 TaxID=3068890 RepID=UPI002796749A|nr:class III extradiol ring-cleavage dioxygenase [Paenibacillus sp. GD4]MDQ1910604.1 class III extradiol ring-cleavage dioxygenase [Paenibacillus sp. GD4]
MYPSFFFSHGEPTLVLEHHAYTRFLRALGMQLPKPAGIVVFSSHWKSPVQKITGSQRLKTMKDVFGLPEALSEFEYPAQGDIVLTLKLQRLFEAEGIACEVDEVHGLDHGAWSVLSLLFPEADVPVVAASVNPRLVPEDCYRIGRAIGELKESGYLILGIGGTVHHPLRMDWEREAAVDAWALEFDAWLEETVQVWDTEGLFDYMARAPYAEKAVPAPEELIPLIISMGVSDRKKRTKLLHQEYQYGNMSLNCYMFS